MPDRPNSKSPDIRLLNLSGHLECDRFIPTASRDWLNSALTSLLGRIVLGLERLPSKRCSSRWIASRNIRDIPLVMGSGLIDRLDNVKVVFADGSESSRRHSLASAAGRHRRILGYAQKQALEPDYACARSSCRDFVR